MMPFFDSVVRFVVTTLFNGLWEAAFLALAAWIALRAMPNANATTRHTILAAALFASLVLPIVTTCITTAQSPPTVHSSATGIARHVPVAALAVPPVRVREDSTRAPAFSVPSLSRLNLTLPRYVAIGLFVAWLLGALYVLVRLAASLVYLERLKRDALPVPIEYRARLERWTTTTKGSRTVRLCRSSETVVPIAVGLFDAMILVPDHLLEELEPKDIDQIVLHELAHLRRADDWINAVERLAQALLFFNPGIIWLVGQLDLEREVACDDWVLQQNDALPYATCLAKVVETTIWPYRAMSAPGAFVTRRAMSVRIERLLSKHRDVRVSASLGPTGLVVAALATLCIGASFVSPSFAYTTVSQAATAAKPATIAQPNHKVTAHAFPAFASPAPASTESSARATPASISRPAVVAAVRSSAAPVAIASLAPKMTVETPAPPRTTTSAVPSAVLLAANSPDYIDELASVGYTGLSVDELVQLRAVGVTADFIRQLADAGIRHPSVADLVKIRALGVQPEFISAVRNRFGASTSIEDIVSLKAVGATIAYVNELSGLGLKDLTIDAVRSLRALGVTPEYVRDLAGAGYPNLTVDQLRQMRAVGIDAAYIQRANAHGFHNLTIEQLVRLRVSGVLE